MCEFCDIPNLYGRNPRLKTPAQILLAVLSASEGVGVVFFSSLMFLRSDNRQRSSALNGMSSVRATHLPLGGDRLNEAQAR